MDAPKKYAERKSISRIASLELTGLIQFKPSAKWEMALRKRAIAEKCSLGQAIEQSLKRDSSLKPYLEEEMPPASILEHAHALEAYSGGKIQAADIIAKICK